MSTSEKNRSPLILAVAIVVIILALTFLIREWKNYSQRAQRSRNLDQLRQIKFALDGFASDFDGQFPNRDTGTALDLAELGFDSSNDYLRQLFISGQVESELLFWKSESPVCSAEHPDNLISRDGQLAPDLILQPGDCHWAYSAEARNTSPVNTPLLADPFAPGTTALEAGRRVIVLRIDGSAGALRAGDEVRCSPATRQQFVQPEPAR